MSKNHDGNVKQYVLLSEAWYGEANLNPQPQHHPETKPFLRRVESVTFGYYYPDGGTSGEMDASWYMLDVGTPPAACLECWDDAWQTLAQFKDVLDHMALFDGEGITPKDFCRLLDTCGFVDATPRKR